MPLHQTLRRVFEVSKKLLRVATQIPTKDFDFDDAVAWWGSVVERNDATKENKKDTDKKDIAFQWWKNKMKDGIKIAFEQLFDQINELVGELEDKIVPEVAEEIITL